MASPETRSKRQRGTVFICYAHEDNESAEKSERWLDRVSGHLNAAGLECGVSAWSDKMIGLGQEWHEEIQESLMEARVAVLLVSVHFLQSNYIREKEVPKMLERQREGNLVIIPLMISPCPIEEAVFHDPSAPEGEGEISLAAFQSPTTASRALSALGEHDQESILSGLATSIKGFLVHGRPMVRWGSEPESSRLTPQRSERSDRAKFLWMTAAILSAVIAIALLQSAFGPEHDAPAGSGARAPERPSVLFGDLSSSDAERLGGATEVDVVRLAMECESEPVRRLAEVFDGRPKVMLELVGLMLDPVGESDVEIDLSAAEDGRLSVANENNVVRLASKSKNEFVRRSADTFGDEPAVLLEIVNALRK